MATFTSRTSISTRREWIVPAPQPWGAFLGDIRAALAAASTTYRDTHGLHEDEPLMDDTLRFRVADDQIIISLTVEDGDTR